MRASLSALAACSFVVGSWVPTGTSHSQGLVHQQNRPSSETTTSQTRQTVPLSLLASLAVRFEENKGQAPKETRFLARGAGYTLLLDRDRLQIDLPQSRRVEMKLLDAEAATITGRQPDRTRTNYYIGNNPAGWHLDIPSYDSVAYLGIYQGVDLIYHGNGRELEYDFVVAPQADPGQVRMRFAGQKLTLEGEDLAFEGINGLRVKALKAYQWIDGTRKTVPASWRIRGDEASIRLGSYNHDRELVIDPIFFYGTYIGGSDNDAAVSIVSATQPGYYYVALSTNSPLLHEPESSGTPPDNPNNSGTDTLILGIDATNAPLPPSPLPPFPATQPLQPSLVVGSVTYLGGTSGITKPTSMTSDHDSNLYITGTTDNVAAFQKLDTQPCLQTCGGFVAKFATSINTTTHAATITLKYEFGLPATPMSIAADDAGDAYLTGRAFATAGKEKLTIPPGDNSFQSVAAAAIGTGANSHAFLLELDPAGSTIFCSYIGGSGSDQGNSVAVAGDSVFVAGQTSSTDFPSTSSAYQVHNAGGQDGFVLEASKLSTSPQLDFSTYLGGAGSDTVASIAIAPSGNLVIAGSTDSTKFPTQPAPSFSYLSWPVNNQKDSNVPPNQVPELPTNPPVLVDLPTAVPGGNQDAFVASLSAGGVNLLFTDFLGGEGTGSITTGQAVRVDDVGVIYMVGSYDGPDGQFLPKYKGPDGKDTNVAIFDLDPNSFGFDSPSPPYQRIFFAEIDPTGGYLLEATIAGGFGVDQANDLLISTPLAAGGTVSIVGSTTPCPSHIDGKTTPCPQVDGTKNPNFFFDAAISAVDAVAPNQPGKGDPKDTTGFFVQEALAGFCSMQLTAQAGTVLTFSGPCVSGTQSGVLYASPSSSSSSGKPFSAPVAVAPSGNSLYASVTVDVATLAGRGNFTFAFLPLGAIGGVGQCQNGTVFLSNCGIVTAGGGAGSLFNVTSGALKVSLACTDANCSYNGTPNTALVGQPVTLTAAVTNAIPETVTWTSSQGVFSGPNPATSITFTPTGAGGPVVIQASPVADPSMKASAITLNTVGVGGGTGSLTILSNASKMVAGTSFQFTANQPVTWGASAGTISSTGEFTAPNPPTFPPSVTITATSQNNSSISATTQVTIFAPPVLVLPASNTLPAGGSISIPISVTAGTGIPGESLMFECAPATLPTGVTCAFSPNPVTNSANAQLSLKLSSAIVGDLLPIGGKSWKHFSSGGPYVIVAACALWMRRRRWPTARGRILCLASGLALLTLLSACGTGGTFSNTSRQGHLTGTYSLNIVVLGATPGAADLNQAVATVPLSVTLQ